ncbi:MAG: nucleotide exchange factor GrpE [Corallococcus sp.]|nr:nucleotide exchange factor GrpE [Corallococcus sp.]
MINDCKQNGNEEETTVKAEAETEKKDKKSKKHDKEDLIAKLTEENQTLAEANDKLTRTVARLQSSADNSDKFRDQLVALKSDFDSYKRRMKNDAEANAAKGRSEVIESVLPVLDTFDIAKGHLDEQNLKAFEMVEAQFVSALKNFGVEVMHVKGCEFDANTMNALSTFDAGEENSGKVVEVYKKGYICGGKVLRYAEVIVGK